MTAQALEFDTDTVLRFVQAHIPGLLRREHMVGIGLRNGGEIVAAVVFENLNRFNVWVHVALAPGGHRLTRRSMLVPFRYAFGVCNVSRMSGYVDASNTACQRFVEHLGFRVEARLAGAAQDGGDVLIYVLWKKDCRYVHPSA